MSRSESRRNRSYSWEDSRSATGRHLGAPRTATSFTTGEGSASFRLWVRRSHGSNPSGIVSASPSRGLPRHPSAHASVTQPKRRGCDVLACPNHSSARRVSARIWIAPDPRRRPALWPAVTAHTDAPDADSCRHPTAPAARLARPHDVFGRSYATFSGAATPWIRDDCRRS